LDIIFIYQIILFLLVFSAIGITYLLRRLRGHLGMALGATIVLIGFVGILDSYTLLSSGVVIGSFAALASVSIAIAYFLVGRRPRVFLLLGALMIPIVSLNVAPLPWSIFFVYCAVCLAVANAYDYAKIDVTSCMRKTKAFLAIFLRPFSVIESLVSRNVRGPHSKLVLTSGYFAVELLMLLGVPFFLSRLSNLFLQFEGLVLVMIIILVAAGRECRSELRGSQGNKPPNH